MNYRITRHIGSKWDLVERCYNEREQHEPAIYVRPKEEEKKKTKKHTDTMSLVDHFMELKEEIRE